jgi:hypothetical protein
MTVEHCTVPEDAALTEIVEPNERVCIIEVQTMAVIEYTEADADGTVTVPEHLSGVDIRIVGIG